MDVDWHRIKIRNTIMHSSFGLIFGRDRGDDMLRGIKRVSALLVSTLTCGTAAEHRFDFERFERNGDAGVEQAKQFLEVAFPAGSDVQPAVAEITRAGAKCQLAHDKVDFYFCEYDRPGHGLMALVSTIGWKVIFLVDSETRCKITGIVVGRGATGL